MLRQCPKCNKDINYNDLRAYQKATKKNNTCRACGQRNKKIGWKLSELTKERMRHTNKDYMKSENYKLTMSTAIKKAYAEGRLKPPHNKAFLGHHHTDEAKLKISIANTGHRHTQQLKDYIRKLNTGRKLTPEQCEKISMAQKGIPKPHSPEHIKALTLAAQKRDKSCMRTDEYRKKHRLRRLQELSKKGNIIPNYNPHACEVIDEYGKEHGYNFQTALKGGEYYIQELGYFVDGYDREKNVVIEYYEPHHNTQKVLWRDERRKREIIDFLKCQFIELKEFNQEVSCNACNNIF